ncbi:MAG: hypothetical protein ACRDH2_11165, partial [Anaerolineales bacterium]
HEMDFARQMADRIVYMDEGCIVEQGHPEQIFTNPADPRTRQFLDRVLVKDMMLLLERDRIEKSK